MSLYSTPLELREGWRRQDRTTSLLSWKESRRRAKAHTLTINLLLAIKRFKMDCCISCRCPLALKIVFRFQPATTQAISSDRDLPLSFCIFSPFWVRWHGWIRRKVPWPAWQAYEREGKGSFSAQNPLSLPFQTPATQANVSFILNLARLY